METSLHRQLKEVFRLPDSEIEVKVGRYRIDVVNEGRLVEIQHSGLSSIRDKVACLLKSKHEVEVIKPLIVRKKLVKLDAKHGRVVDQRWSPKRGTILDLFDELVYFTRVFPHRNLNLIVPMVEVLETRYPGHGRRRRRRKNDFLVEDRRLVNVETIDSFRSAADLHRLLPKSLPQGFDTGQLAKGLGLPRWQAQRIAYVLKNTGSAKAVGKNGNAVVYELVKETGKPKKAANKSAKKPVSDSAKSRQSRSKSVDSSPGKRNKKKSSTSPTTKSRKRRTAKVA